MAPKKSSRVKKPSKKILESLEAPPHSETESESLLTQREICHDSPQEPPSEDTELYSQTQTTRSLPPTPKGKGKGKNTVPVPPKKARVEEDVSKITAEMEEELVEFFESNPIFYDQRRTDFKNRSKRDRLLQDKGDELGVSMNTIMTWFRNMRTIYGKLKKKKSGQSAKALTARQQWTHDKFAFLEHHLLVRAQTRVLGGAEAEGEEEESDQPDDGSDQPLAAPSASAPAATEPKPKKKADSKAVDEAIVTMVDRINSKVSVTEKLDTTLASQNNRSLFCTYMSAEAQTWTAEQFTEFQREVMTLMWRYRQQLDQPQVVIQQPAAQYHYSNQQYYPGPSFHVQQPVGQQAHVQQPAVQQPHLQQPAVQPVVQQPHLQQPVVQQTYQQPICSPFTAGAQPWQSPTLSMSGLFSNVPSMQPPTVASPDPVCSTSSILKKAKKTLEGEEDSDSSN